ncbi:MAG: alpha-1,4-glucan--maltose-1-phosphate maltosyltransferase [Myxococcota bacterium]|nr:alpha-1,4-glucan--maltose-1-phosphate maltosyltransferase [Myxococcota bacterium]
MPTLPTLTGRQPRVPPPSLRRRVVIEAVCPQVDGGRVAAKRVMGDRVTVSCDLICDGHDVVAGRLLYRTRPRHPETLSDWRSERLVALGNDRYAAPFVVAELGCYEFAIEAWVDALSTWLAATRKKLDAALDIPLELLAGASLLRGFASRAQGAEAALLARAAQRLELPDGSPGERFVEATDAAVLAAAARYPDLADATRTDVYLLLVDPPRARFSSWYEMFPRSAGSAGKHGTLRDCAERLPYVAGMGFDVLYLPPIHPIGRAFRKGPNNALEAGPDDVGSPWAIGSAEGGHKAVHPELGTLEDLRSLVGKARSLGIEVALDVALQASPDHPYVQEHPEWFEHRADGSIQYAENPPKKYQDIYPFDFESKAWEPLWQELASIFFFWCEQGIRLFRVDTPHTKPVRFWEWCLSEVKARHPDALFLAEAFTRPKLMYALAKAGFSQSYTYFAWRHTKAELIQFMEELTRPPVADFYRPCFWPNTPDILTEYLQFGGRAAFVQRLLLAATLSSNYGIYGPPFELMDTVARPGTEEYADNEKYQLRSWDTSREDSLRDVVALVNRIRRANPALQENRLTFHRCDDDQLLVFSKRSADGANVVLVVINLDAHHTHAAVVDLDMPALGLPPDEAFQVHDVLVDARYQWHGDRAYVEIDPNVLPGSVFVVRRKVRTEQDFDYFL